MKLRTIIQAAVLLSGLLVSQVFAETNSEQGYVLDSGDRIAIQVFDENELTMEALIDQNGIINYSFLGPLEVSGKTTEQLETTITDLLRGDYLVNPSVNVTITSYRPFYIGGEVARPGAYPYVPGLTLEQAVAIAGGMTDRGSRRKMYLVDPETSDKKRLSFSSSIGPGDTISIQEGFF